MNQAYKTIIFTPSFCGTNPRLTAPPATAPAGGRAAITQRAGAAVPGGGWDTRLPQHTRQ